MKREEKKCKIRWSIRQSYKNNKDLSRILKCPHVWIVGLKPGN